MRWGLNPLTREEGTIKPDSLVLYVDLRKRKWQGIEYTDFKFISEDGVVLWIPFHPANLHHIEDYIREGRENRDEY